MRPLKPYLLALGGFLAAVFSAVFPGAQPGARIPAAAPQPDLQATRPAPATVLATSAEARADRKAPAPLPEFPVSDRPRGESLRAAPPWSLLLAGGVRARECLIDQRLRLLVGVVELRI